MRSNIPQVGFIPIFLGDYSLLLLLLLLSLPLFQAPLLPLHLLLPASTHILFELLPIQIIILIDLVVPPQHVADDELQGVLALIVAYFVGEGERVGLAEVLHEGHLGLFQLAQQVAVESYRLLGVAEGLWGFVRLAAFEFVENLQYIQRGGKLIKRQYLHDCSKAVLISRIHLQEVDDRAIVPDDGDCLIEAGVVQMVQMFDVQAGDDHHFLLVSGEEGGVGFVEADAEVDFDGVVAYGQHAFVFAGQQQVDRVQPQRVRLAEALQLLCRGFALADPDDACVGLQGFPDLACLLVHCLITPEVPLIDHQIGRHHHNGLLAFRTSIPHQILQFAVRVLLSLLLIFLLLAVDRQIKALQHQLAPLQTVRSLQFAADDEFLPVPGFLPAVGLLGLEGDGSDAEGFEYVVYVVFALGVAGLQFDPFEQFLLLVIDLVAVLLAFHEAGVVLVDGSLDAEGGDGQFGVGLASPFLVDDAHAAHASNYYRIITITLAMGQE